LNSGVGAYVSIVNVSNCTFANNELTSFTGANAFVIQNSSDIIIANNSFNQFHNHNLFYIVNSSTVYVVDNCIINSTYNYLIEAVNLFGDTYYNNGCAFENINDTFSNIKLSTIGTFPYPQSSCYCAPKPAIINIATNTTTIIIGNFTIEPTQVINVQVSSISPTSKSLLNITGCVVLNGTLNLTISELIKDNILLPLITSPCISGNFGQVLLTQSNLQKCNKLSAIPNYGSLTEFDVLIAVASTCSDSSSSVGIGVGAGVGGFIIIAIIVIIILYIFRQKLVQPKSVKFTQQDTDI